ncbi:MAG: tetratricopeptide repeat protein [Pseudomonadales bacterium]|nr:tetratricopeptide repeat protein [Pseudomonadales bacterium]MCP5184752.1 tetratricopeptide repeat protein [Pseudomonadales bacterium]
MNTQLTTHDYDRLNAARNLHIEGLLDQARPVYDQLLRKYPANDDVQSLMAALLLDTGAADEALPLLRAIAVVRGADADVHYNLGLANAKCGDDAAAALAYRRSVQLNARHPRAWYNLALSLQRLGDIDGAIEALEQDFGLQPSADTARLLAHLHGESNHDAGRLFYANRCVELDGATPQDLNLMVGLEAKAMGNTSDVPREKVEELLALAAHALDLSPRDANAWKHLALVLAYNGEYEAALPIVETAWQLDPSLDGLRELYNIVLLTLGRLEEGWRMRTQLLRTDAMANNIGLPRWQGRLRPGLKLLVKWEQGLGDQILYARMLVDLLQAGVEVTFVGEERLIPLFRRSMPALRIEPLVEAEAKRNYDAFITLGELHIWLRPDLDHLPAPAPWLVADEARVAEFRARYARLYPGKRTIGLSWLSHSTVYGASKSLQLDVLEPVLRLPDTVFVCTQYGLGADTLRDAGERLGVPVHIDDDVDGILNPDRQAAQLMALDDLVSVSNTTVHLAGALGVRTHVLVSRRPVWHWFAHGTQSPWYPNVHLYRQSHLDSWQEPVAALVEGLRHCR